MKITTHIKNGLNTHHVEADTKGSAKSISIPPGSGGYGSSVNGGEMLLLALATCFCNDLYREAAKRNIQVAEVDVECTADFDAEGEPGKNFRYRVHVTSDAPPEVIEALIRHTDQVAEVHNTLRKGVTVTLAG